MLNSWIDRIFALLVLALVPISLYAYDAVQREERAKGPVDLYSAAPLGSPRGFPAGFERDPGYVEARLGFRALVDGDLVTALAHFEGAIERSPDNPAWRFMLSDAHRASGDERRARLEARKAQDMLRTLEPARASAIPN